MKTTEPNHQILEPLLLLWKHKVKILGLSFLIAVIAAIITLIKPNYYESSSLFYPANTDLAKPLPIGNQSKDIDYYGEAEDLDRLLAIAKSGELKEYLIDKFDLYTHYDIDSTGAKARYAMSLKLAKHYNSEKTNLDAVKLTVEDKDPVFAKDMVNAATDKLSEIAQRIVKQGQHTQLQSYQSAVAQKTGDLAHLTEKIAGLRKKYDIYDLESQSQSYADLLPMAKVNLVNSKSRYNSLKNSSISRDTLAILQSKVDGYQSQVSDLETSLKKFNEGYLPLMTLQEEQEDYLNQLNLDKQRVAQLESAYGSPFNAIHLIEKGDVPFIKSRPQRTLIVLGSAIASVLFLSLLVLIQDFIKRIDFSTSA